MLLVFALASFVAVALGCVAMAAAGAAPGTWGRNLAAWAAGGALAVPIACGRGERLSKIFLAAAPVGLAATFLAPAQQSVHRWIDLGPLHVNVAALLLPAGVVAIALIGLRNRLGLLSAAACAALLLLQPDASQASAFAAALIVLLVRGLRPAAAAGGAAAALLLTALAWLRPDPLQPLPEVEGIFGLAAAASLWLAAAAALALAAASLAPLMAARTAAASALATYFAVVALCPALGAFPVPLVGLGMSFPVGHWLAVGLLSAAAVSAPTVSSGRAGDRPRPG